jgi:hypothetical protein
MATREKTKQRKTPKQQRPFCTTCGDVLESYCFAPEATDMKEMVKHLASCKAEGRLQGRVCAKLFIGGTDGLYQNTKKRRTPKRSLEGLKEAILKEISKEAKRKT